VRFEIVAFAGGIKYHFAQNRSLFTKIIGFSWLNFQPSWCKLETCIGWFEPTQELYEQNTVLLALDKMLCDQNDVNDVIVSISASPKNVLIVKFSRIIETVNPIIHHFRWFKISDLKNWHVIYANFWLLKI